MQYTPETKMLKAALIIRRTQFKHCISEQEYHSILIYVHAYPLSKLWSRSQYSGLGRIGPCTRHIGNVILFLLRTAADLDADMAAGETTRNRMRRWICSWRCFIRWLQIVML